MHSVIVGTAGHVDHGKTCLIKALTGTDTDRLKEEKQRGITIELGFTEMPNDRGLNIGIIDVPGHERFVKNMLAGIGGIDLVLLVIAADEGVMPQTKEHFEILKMLGISKGIVVLTKVDAVEEDWLEIVKEDVADYLKGSFLEGAPIVETSAYTGKNIDHLKTLICDMVDLTTGRKEEASLLRLPVDRVFIIGGFGTVITGTLLEGSCRVGDEVEIYPEGRLAKIRNLQVHGKMVDRAAAGMRTAMNLANIKKEEIRRGNVIAAKGSLERTMLLDVKLSMFSDSKRTLVNGSRLHFFYGSDEVLCKAVLLNREILEAGQEDYAQLRFTEEIALKKGDRFIIRFYSPVETMGGGIVLDAHPKKHKRFQTEALQALEIKESGDPEALLEQTLLEGSRSLRPFPEISRKLGFLEEEGKAHLNSLLEQGKVISLSGEIAVHRDYLNQAGEKVASLLSEFHRAYPISRGMVKEEFRKRVGTLLFLKESKEIDLLIKAFIGEKVIKDEGNIISRFDFGVTYTSEQQALRDKLFKIYEAAGYEAPELSEVLDGQKDKALSKALIEDMSAKGELVKLNQDYLITAGAWEKALSLLKKGISESLISGDAQASMSEPASEGRITLAQFRDLLGTSRKYAVLLLTAFDEKKITVMEGEARRLL